MTQSPDFDFSRFDEPNRAELLNDIVEDVEHVVHALDIQGEPDLLDRTFYFRTDKHPNFRLPGSIQESISPDSTPYEVEIEVAENNLTGNSSLGLRVAFDGHEPFSVYVSPPDRPDQAHVATHVLHRDIPEVVLATDESPEFSLLLQPSKPELNAMVASLIAPPHKTRGYEIYEAMDLTNAKQLHLIAEALEGIADEHTSDALYFTDGMAGPDASHVRVSKVNGKAASARSQMSLPRGAMAADVVIDRSLVVESDIDEAFSAESLEGVRTYRIDIDGRSEECPSEPDVLVPIYDFLVAMKTKMFVESPQLSGNDFEDESTITNVEALKELKRQEDD